MTDEVWQDYTPSQPEVWSDYATPQAEPGFLSKAWDWMLTRPNGQKIDPLTADYWTSPISGGPPKSSAAEQIVGPAMQGLNGLTFGFGDELVAGGSSLIDALRGQNIGDAYDQRLSRVRDMQKGFEAEHPYLSGVMGVGGALKTPILNIAGKISNALPQATTTMGNIGRVAAITPAVAAEGAGYGSLYGFGSGEGEANRLENALSGAESGAKWGAALGAPLVAAGEVASRLAPSADDAANAIQRHALGARGADYKKTAKDLDFFDIPVDDSEIETITKKALDKIANSGVLRGEVDPAQTTKLALREEKRLAGEIGAEIAAVDATRAGRRISPKFNNALKYVNSGKIKADEVDSYIGKIRDLKNAIKEKGGSLRFLQGQKTALRGKYIEGDDAANGFWRAMYHDVQAAIESEAPKVKALNKELQSWKIVTPILKKGLGAQEGANPLEKAYQFVRTSGAKTITGPALLGATVGGSLGGPIGGALGGKLGAAAGAGLGIATSAKGQQAISKGLKSLDKVAPKLTKAASRTTAIVGETKSANQPKKLRPVEEAYNEIQQKKAIETPKILSAKRMKDLPDDVEKEIKSDKYLHAAALAESNMNPKAKNPTSTAAGLFQFIDKTARALGLKDKLDARESLVAMKKLTAENKAVIGNDPEWLYAAHVLGAPLAKKLKQGKLSGLDEKDRKLVRYFQTEALPNFRRRLAEVVQA